MLHLNFSFNFDLQLKHGYSTKKDNLLACILTLKEIGTHSAENSVVQIPKSIQQEIFDFKTNITSLEQENTNARNIESNKNSSKKVKCWQWWLHSVCYKE